MRLLGLMQFRAPLSHKTAAVAPDKHPVGTRAFWAVHLALAAIVLLFTCPVSAQVSDPFEDCAKAFSSPPLSALSFNTSRSTLPIISSQDSNRMVGLKCSKEVVVDFFKSKGWGLEKASKYAPSNDDNPIDAQYIFCYPETGWRRIIKGRCAARLIVNSLRNEIVGVGAFGAK